LKKINKKGKPVGVVVKAKTTKSKTSRPFRDCQFSIVFDYGLDNIGSNLDYLYELRTDKGELTPAAKSISWGSGENKKQTLSIVKRFLKGIDYIPEGRKRTINALVQLINEVEKVNLENALIFIEAETKIQKLYNKEFGADGGKVMSRDVLIEYIESNNLEKELAEKVIEKWENIESDIASKRKKRYATQPKAGEEE
jgi:RecA/RadA recombinase